MLHLLKSDFITFYLCRFKMAFDGYSVKNDIPHDIIFLTIKDLKRDALIVAALLAADAVPFIGWIAAAADSVYIAKTVLKLKDSVSFILRVLRFAVIAKDTTTLDYVNFGKIAPGKEKNWFEGGIHTCEALIQVAVFTDAAKTSKVMGSSAIIEPARSSYTSRIEKVYYQNGTEVASWNSNEIISAALHTVFELLTWIEKIIQSVLGDKEEHLLQNNSLNSRQDLEILMNRSKTKGVLKNFRLWASKLTVPLETADKSKQEYLILKNSPENREVIVMLQKNLSEIKQNYNSGPFTASYESYRGLPVVVWIFTKNGKDLPFIDKSSPIRETIGGWNITKNEMQRGGGLIYLPIMLTRPNSYDTYGSVWHRQGLHIHAPALNDTDAKQAVKYENLQAADPSARKRIQQGSPFSNSISEWIINLDIPGGKRTVDGADVRCLHVIDSDEHFSSINTLETYVKEVQLANPLKFNNRYAISYSSEIETGLLQLNTKYYLKNRITEQYLDCENKFDGHGHVYGRRNFDAPNHPIGGNGPQSKNPHQQWLLQPSHDEGTYYLKNIATQHYLDCEMKIDRHGHIYGRSNAASHDNSNGPASNNYNQQWQLQQAHGGSYFYLKNKATSHYLDCSMKTSNWDGLIYGRSNEATRDLSNGPESNNYNQQWQFELSLN